MRNVQTKGDLKWLPKKEDQSSFLNMPTRAQFTKRLTPVVAISLKLIRVSLKEVQRLFLLFALHRNYIYTLSQDILDSIWMLITYRMFINTSGLKGCSYKRMKYFQDISVETPP